MLFRTRKFQVLMLILFFATLISFSIASSSSEAAKSNQTQPKPQTIPNNKKSGWQIYEIEYPKTPKPRDCAASVYDGTLFYIFSGTESYYDHKILYKDCWYYNPKTDIWNEIEVPEYVTGRLEADMFYIKDKLVIYGGYRIEHCKRVDLNDGYIISHKISGFSWNKISDIWAPDPLKNYSAIATDDKMIVFGGIDDDDNFSNSCREFDPLKNEWSRIDTPDKLLGRYDHNALWTGEKMLITGGVTSFNTIIEEQEKWNYDKEDYEKVKVPVNYNVTTKQAAAYDPKTNTWEMFQLPDARAEHTAVWTGSYAILWGGYSGNGKEESWVHNTNIIHIGFNGKFESYGRDKNILAARTDHIAFWTGKDMLIGFGDNTQAGGCEMYRSGGLYDPDINFWQVPNNCPFTINSRKYENQTFIDEEHVIYNFNFNSSLTGKYIADKDLFLNELGNGYQPRYKDLKLLDTPDGIFVSHSYEYPNERIWTYAFWKFNENLGRFKRIDQNRKDVLYDKCNPFWRNNKIYFNTSFSGSRTLRCKEGFVNIYDDKNNKWLHAHTDGIVPIDRYLCAKSVSDDYLYVTGGLFSSLMQYSDAFDYGWENRAPDSYFGLEEWHRPWFKEQLRIAKQSKSYPVLDDGFTYSFKENRWKPINSESSPSPRICSLSSTFKDKFALFGGFTEYRFDLPVYVNSQNSSDIIKLIRFDGGIYDPGTDSWSKIAKLETDKIKIEARTFNSLKISQFCNNILLYKYLKTTGYNTIQNIHDKFIGFVYDIEKHTWKELTPPNENAYFIDNIINFSGKTLVKIYEKVSDDDEYHDDYREISKWYLYDCKNGNWTECSINQYLDKDYENLTFWKEFRNERNEVNLFIKNHNLIFYTNAPKTDESEELEYYEINRNILKIYSYDPVYNKVTKLTEMETNINNLICETDNQSSSAEYCNKKRLCFIGINASDIDEYENANKLSVLIYNLPEN